MWHDLLGLTEGRAPRFVKRYGHLAEDIRAALSTYAPRSVERHIPSRGARVRHPGRRTGPVRVGAGRRRARPRGGRTRLGERLALAPPPLLQRVDQLQAVLLVPLRPDPGHAQLGGEVDRPLVVRRNRRSKARHAVLGRGPVEQGPDGLDGVPLAAVLWLQGVADLGEAALIRRAVEVRDPNDLRGVGPGGDGTDEPRLVIGMRLDLAQPKPDVASGGRNPPFREDQADLGRRPMPGRRRGSAPSGSRSGVAARAARRR